MANLKTRAIVGFAQLLVALAALLFGAAWTFDFWQAWVYLLVFGASTTFITVYLWRNDPKLLERRVTAGPTAERERSQQVIQALAAVAFCGLFLVPSLDRRFAWSHVPLPVVIAGDALVTLGLCIVFLVFKENTFTAATIAVATDQYVVSSGPYAIVRHPMYAGALLLLLGTPLALGSWWGLLLLVPMLGVIVWRLLDEEQFLRNHLPGYAAYCRKTRYRLIPGIW
jgi:protein-S-isoprenylcysteine O-methyltransferase Ste14